MSGDSSEPFGLTLYVLDERGYPKPEDDSLRWARWYDNTNRVLLRTWLHHRVLVTTVFLGADQRKDPRRGLPILWRTDVWEKDKALEHHSALTRQHASDRGARAYHRHVCDELLMTPTGR